MPSTADADARQQNAASSESLERRVRSGAAWKALNTLLLRFSNIAITAVVVRLVSPREFGVFAVALAVSAVVASFADWGVSSCLIRGDLDPDEVGPSVALVAMLSGLLLAAGMAVGAPALAAVFASPQAVDPIRVIAVCVAIGGAVAVPSALLNREFQQRRLLLTNVVGFIPANVVLILLAAHGAGAMAFAWSQVVGAVFTAVAIVVVARRTYWPRVERTHLRMVLRFGLPLAGANLVNYSLLNADYAFVAHQLGAALLGVYLLAFNVASWSSAILSGSVNSVAMPAFSRVHNDPARLALALRRSSRAVSLVAMPIAALTCALASPLVTTLYGDKWGASAQALTVLSVYGGFFIVVSLLSNLLVGAGRSAGVLVIQLVWMGVLVPCMALGVRVDGVVGVAWAHVAVLMLVVVPLYLWQTSRRGTGLLRGVAIGALPPVAVAALAGLAAFAVAHWSGSNSVVQLISGGCAGATVYAICAAPMVSAYLTPPQRARLGRLGTIG